MKGVSRLGKISSKILDSSSVYPDVGTFPTSRKESHKSAHRLQQGRLLLVITLGDNHRKSLGEIQLHNQYGRNKPNLKYPMDRKSFYVTLWIIDNSVNKIGDEVNVL